MPPRSPARRREGLTRNLPGDVVERIFALAFALEQLHRNFIDLARCLDEFAQSTGVMRKNDARRTGHGRSTLTLTASTAAGAADH